MECELKIFFYLSLVLVFIMVHSAVCVYPCRSFNFYEVNNFNLFFLIWILNHFRNALTILRLWKISLMFSDFFFFVITFKSWPTWKFSWLLAEGMVYKLFPDGLPGCNNTFIQKVHVFPTDFPAFLYTKFLHWKEDYFWVFSRLFLDFLPFH